MSVKSRMKDMEYMISADVAEIADAVSKAGIILDIKKEGNKIVFLRKTMKPKQKIFKKFIIPKKGIDLETLYKIIDEVVSAWVEENERMLKLTKKEFLKARIIKGVLDNYGFITRSQMKFVEENLVDERKIRDFADKIAREEKIEGDAIINFIEEDVLFELLDELTRTSK